MKMTELKNRNNLETMLEKRLVWQAGRENPGASDTPENKVEKTIDASERLNGDDLRELANRIKNLTLNGGQKIDIDKNNHKVTAQELLGSLRNQMDTEKVFENKKIKNADLYVINGLLENIGKADTVPSSFGQNEKTGLTTWLKEKKITKFSITDGYWSFFDKDGKAIQADYKLNAQGQKAPTNSDKAILTAEVGQQKVVEAQEKTSEADRLKVEKLETVSSKGAVALDGNSLDGTLKALENQLLDEKGRPAIKVAEMKVALLAYMDKAHLMEGKDENLRFAAFVKLLSTDGYDRVNMMAVENGKLVFTCKENPTIKNANPLKIGLNGRMDRVNSYAHDSLRVKEDDQNKAKAEQEKVDLATAMIDKSDKKTPYDETEAKMQAVLEVPLNNKKPQVDARYLEAYNAILKYDPAKNETVNFNLAFNDKQLSCTFFRDAKGAFILRYGTNENSNTIFYPDKNSKNPFEDAKRYFANSLNSGEILQKVQWFNVRDKNNFSSLGIKIDNGPTEVGNKVEYELGWKTGVTEKDPHIFIETLPHGEISVQMKKGDIGFSKDSKSNNDQYNFVAGGFHDMIRILRSLKEWHENPAKMEATQQNEETERRFFQRGTNAFKSEIPADLKVGNLLKVRSVPSNLNYDLGRGVEFKFDWMEKTTPPQVMQLFKNGDKYNVMMDPAGKVIGIINAPLSNPANYRQLMELTAAQRSEMMENGGEKLDNAKLKALLNEYNQKIVGKPQVALRDGVMVKGYSEIKNGSHFVYLSLGEGMKPQNFDFQINTINAGAGAGWEFIQAPGIEEALTSGYLVEASSVKPVEAVAAKPVEAKETPKNTFNIARDNNEKSVISPEAVEQMKKILSKINGERKQNVQDALMINFTGLGKKAGESSGDYAKRLDDVTYDALRDYLEIKDDATVDANAKSSGKSKVELDYLIAKINNPNSLSQNDRRKDDETDKRFDKYREYHHSFNLIKIYLANVRIAQNEIKDGKVEAKDFKNTYADHLDKLLETKFTELEKGKDKVKFNGQIDEEMSTFLFQTLKTPRTEMSDQWKDALEADKAKIHEDAVKEKQQKDLAQEKDPNGLSFIEFDRQEKVGLADEASRILKETAGLKPENIFLSKIIDNNSVLSNVLSFNVRSGVENNYKPYTLNFTHEDGRMMVRAAPGWNNRQVFDGLTFSKRKVIDGMPEPIAVSGEDLPKGKLVDLNIAPPGVMIVDDPVKDLLAAADLNMHNQDIGREKAKLITITDSNRNVFENVKPVPPAANSVTDVVMPANTAPATPLNNASQTSNLPNSATSLNISTPANLDQNNQIRPISF